MNIKIITLKGKEYKYNLTNEESIIWDSIILKEGKFAAVNWYRRRHKPQKENKNDGPALFSV